MKNNRVLFATLVVLLWTVNALNLQPYEFELRSTVAISKHRVPLLRNLAGEPNSIVSVAGQTVGMRVVSCDVFEADKVASRGLGDSSNDADLQTVKVRVRYQKFADVESIEKWLESQTRPSCLSDRCQSIKGKLRSAKWRLGSLEHTQRVLGEDQKRRAEQFALRNEDKPATIKLVGFHRNESLNTSEQVVIDGLVAKIQHERNTIEQLSEEWNREVAISNGFLQFSGAPKWFPVAEPVGWRRGLAFIVLSCAIWGICRFLMDKVGHWILVGRRLPNLLTRAPMASLNIPHLGHVELVVSSESGIGKLVLQRQLDANERSREKQLNSKPISNSRFSKGESWIRGIVASGFVSWAAIVAARLVFDPAWRSLFVSAPLAALSNLIAGVGL
ncbi:MAG: hypothetical protein ACK5YR_23445 [Pirellula sp.]